MLESSSLRVETHLHHLLHRLTPVCNSASVFVIFPSCRCTNALSWSTRPIAAFPGPLFLRCSGGCSSCALLCAVQGCMSACRTRPEVNPGGPQGGAQTGRSPRGGGGGGWTEAEPPALRNQMLRGVPPPRQDRFSGSPERTRRPNGRPEFRTIDYKITKCATL